MASHFSVFPSNRQLFDFPVINGLFIFSGKILQAVREERALLSNKEIADGITYEDPLQTCWTPPKWIIQKGEKYVNHIRKTKEIIVQGAVFRNSFYNSKFYFFYF